MPRVFARGLSNKIAPGESLLHLIYIIDKAPLVPGGGSWAESNHLQWLGLTTIYVFVPTAENLQPNQIAAFKRETLQLNLADKARWLTVFLQRCSNSMNSSCQISRLLEKNHGLSYYL